MTSQAFLLNRFLRSEAGAVVLWVFAALLLAGGITPVLYDLGNALAVATASGEWPRVLEWLGAACGRADFSRYFNRALMLAALLLLPVLRWRIRGIDQARPEPIVTLVRLSWKSAALQTAVGLLVTAGITWSLCEWIEASGAYTLRSNLPDSSKLVDKVLFPTVVVSLLEEWLFRGVLLGLWLRLAKPVVACMGTSLFFAFVHFLSLPEGEVLTDLTSGWAGYELLGKIGLHFIDPLFIVTDFLTLFAIGMVLAWARIRTGALWFSIGLHAGWICAFKTFNLYHRPIGDHWLFPWGLGETLRSGLLPLLSVVVVAGICRGYFHYLHPRKTAA